MIRQLWVFLEEEDERELIARLSAEAPLAVLRGRFFRGGEAELRAAPGGLETRELTSREHRTFLLHREASAQLVVHHHEDGPLAGWSTLDEVRSEVVVIHRPEREPQGLAPARILASTHAWFAGTRLRKSPAFTTWVSRVMKHVEQTYPPTSLDWIRVAPAALRQAHGGGRLHYLYKEVSPVTGSSG